MIEKTDILYEQTSEKPKRYNNAGKIRKTSQ